MIHAEDNVNRFKKILQVIICSECIGTCLLSTLSMPGVSPVSVFWVATGISRRSFTGGVSPFAMARKYLKESGL